MRPNVDWADSLRRDDWPDGGLYTDEKIGGRSPRVGVAFDSALFADLIQLNTTVLETTFISVVTGDGL